MLCGRQLIAAAFRVVPQRFGALSVSGNNYATNGNSSSSSSDSDSDTEKLRKKTKAAASKAKAVNKTAAKAASPLASAPASIEKAAPLTKAKAAKPVASAAPPTKAEPAKPVASAAPPSKAEAVSPVVPAAAPVSTPATAKKSAPSVVVEGLVVDLDKSSLIYKAPEYHGHSELTFYDYEVEMEAKRIKQPDCGTVPRWQFESQ